MKELAHTTIRWALLVLVPAYFIVPAVVWGERGLLYAALILAAAGAAILLGVLLFNTAIFLYAAADAAALGLIGLWNGWRGG